ncbi:DEAD/DEAH box helicase [Corynebacterium nuruki]|uniref:DEAD/DEAH box helicase n=1 Tax=Corynebacterium nuruki TaxID=1032851 RepID=UPI0039BF80A9
MSSLLPVHTADQINSGVTEYLTTSFSLADTATGDRLAEFLTDTETGMFHGPYVRTRLPYAPDDSGQRFFDWQAASFVPYRHQAEAFRRLASLTPTGEQRRPDPTLVITGTGSGKTESFLYPILEHCRRNPGRGMKALILYPMNALATDQERRLAEIISTTAALSGVTAGIYTGEQSGGQGGRTTVSSRGLISSRELIRGDVPDILLTNYKMLDQLLLREEDKQIWVDSATTLQYLVLDEFHTYDGAQGTDVALLLRRLGLALKTHQPSWFLSADEAARPLGRITPVATSATLGGRDNLASMLDFAHTIFGEKLDESAIITETSLDYDQWVTAVNALVGAPDADVTDAQAVPDHKQVEAINTAIAEALADGTDYQSAVHTVLCRELWHCADDRDGAIAAYTRHPLTKALVAAASSPVPLAVPETGTAIDPETGEPEVIRPLIDILPPAVRRLPQNGAAEFLSHLLSDIAWLRADYVREHSWTGKTLPGVDTHLWVREVSRVDRTVSSDPGGHMFRWADDGPQADADDTDWLPACYCRVCGRSGWMLSKLPGDVGYETSPAKIRAGSLRSPELQLPLLDATDDAVGRDAGADSAVYWLDLSRPDLLLQRPDEEALETGNIIPVLSYAGDNREDRAKQETCPSCGTQDSIRYLGSSVATLLSVALSNLFGEPDLDDADKKTLVFTDSVQDAAHRAGFIQSRARAFALRTRIRDAVGTEPATLRRMLDQIITDAGDNLRTRYELIPPHMADWDAFKAFWEPKSDPGARRHAEHAVRDRLAIDLLLEFGQRADLPRSLTSTGALTTQVDISDSTLSAAATAAVSTVDLPMFDIDLLGWARGVVEIIRANGGIDHPLFNSYLSHACNPYMLARRPVRQKGMPSFPKGGAPAFPRAGSSLTGSSRDHSRAMPLGSPQSFWARWTTRSLGLGSPMDGATAVTALLKELARRGELRTVTDDAGGTVYALADSAILVASEDTPALLECPACHARLAVAAPARAAMTGQPCRNLDCTGTYEEVPIEDNYYRRLYTSTTPRTIVSREHTSLLDKKTRRRVEDQFKAPETTAPDAPNVLVATPTLEMGIDIGDLSTVMLASLPNAVSNYVQRVGRAGRLTGNSLIVALVQGRGRALPTLERPLSMIAGSVEAPAAFLSAEEILHRQFSAYLLDRTKLAEHMETPHLVDDVFSMRTTGSPTVVEVLLEMASSGVEEALTAFTAPLAAHVPQHVLTDLTAWATGDGQDSFTGELMAARKSWNAETHELASQENTLEIREAELSRRAESPAADDDVKAQHRSTRAALRAVQRRRHELTTEYWINALERYGILPNFTLLDESVDLHLSVSFLDKDLEFDTKTYDYSRGASAALTELAPGATFYAQGVAATIDAVDLGPDNAYLQRWRVCPACSHSEVLSPDDSGTSAACPSCGAPAWRDVAQVIDVLPLHRVFAEVEQTRAAITDSREDRTQTKFHQNMSMRVPDGTAGTRWYLSGTGFGIRHFPQVELRWMNLGRGSGQRRSMASLEVEAPLFTVCSRCGHTATVKHEGDAANSWKDHRPWCPLRAERDPDPLTIALGRTLNTEGVLLRLPQLLTVADSATVPSVIAAIRLGFKESLGGNPDHLNVAGVRVGSGDDSYEGLLLHDTVPGGTGYLTEFTSVRDVEALLHAAYRRVSTCHCRNEHRGACPDCLLPFAPPGAAESLSRAAAESALAKILLDDLHPAEDADPATAQWAGSSVTEEVPEVEPRSKLESLFLHELQAGLEARGATLKKKQNGGYAEWTLQLPDSPHRWRMQEQKNLGKTIPDFYFEAEDSSVSPVALYLDGAAFHRSEAHNRVAGDVEKRNWLAAEHKVPWTLTWKDVEDFRAREDNDRSLAYPAWYHPQYNEALAGSLRLSSADLATLAEDPMSQLFAYLRRPEADWWNRISTAATIHAVDLADGGATNTYYSGVTVAMEQTAAGAAATLDLAAASDVDPENYDRSWEMFWSLANLIYFNQAGHAISARTTWASVTPRTEDASPTPGQAAERSGAVPAELGESSPPADTADTVDSGNWSTAAEEFADDPEAAEAIRVLIAHGVASPDSWGDEIAQVSTIVAWEAPRIAVVFPGDADDAAGGWTFVDTDEVCSDQLPASLLSLTTADAGKQV